MKSDIRQRARQTLDERLLPFKSNAAALIPPRGWIRAIREALGMSGVQLAKRLGTKPQNVEALEKSEASGTVQLNTLRRVAEALDCQLVYAFVPNNSLEGAVQDRARSIAVRELESVAHTMALEAQGTGESTMEARIARYIRDELRDRDLWNEP